MKKFLRVTATLLSAAAILDSLYWLFVGHSYLRVAFLKLTGGNGIAFVNRQRGQPAADAKTQVDATDIDIAVQRQTVILPTLIPPRSTGNHGNEGRDNQPENDRFFHDSRLLCVKPCRIRSM